MSTPLAQQLKVSSCISTLCSVYHEGAVLLQKIKSKRKGLDISAQELELAINSAESGVRDSFDSTYQYVGHSFAQGDRLATDALEIITVHVKGQVIDNLEAHFQQDIRVDFTVLQDVCDSTQERTTLVLMQLQQRLIASGAVDVTPMTLDSANAVSRSSTVPTFPKANRPTGTILTAVIDSTETQNGNVPTLRKPMSSFNGPLTPPTSPFPPQLSRRPGSSMSRMSTSSGSTIKREPQPYKPMATTVSKTGFLGIGKRTIVEPITSPRENPLVDEYCADALESSAQRRSRPISIVTSDTSIYEPDHPAHNSWQDHRSQSPASSHKFSASLSSFDSIRSISTDIAGILRSNQSIQSFHSTNSKEVLPNESNNYAGFCKGAWRQQIGDTKRAMEERVRPGGMYNQAKYWQCRHCKFEGRLVPANGKKSGYDIRVFKLVDGIQFRWEFMFKSHVASKDAADPNPTKATFGCIFCCSEGKRAPTFEGIQSLMNHLREHRENLPTGDVLYRMNCLVGRQAAMGEDFDMNLVSADECQL